MNNRPLSYLEEDIQASVLTPNSMLQINPSYLPELETQQIEGEDLRKWARILKNCKSAMWKRWSREYVRSLREQHRNLWRNGQSYPKIGYVVIVHDEDQPRNRWKLAIVTGLITGKDNITRGAVLKTGKGTIDELFNIYTHLNCFVIDSHDNTLTRKPQNISQDRREQLRLKLRNEFVKFQVKKIEQTFWNFRL